MAVIRTLWFAMITVESRPEAIQITIPRTDLDPAQIEAILRPLRFAGIVAQSEMSKEQALEIAEDSKSDWWEKNQSKFVPPDGK